MNTPAIGGGRPTMRAVVLRAFGPVEHVDRQLVDADWPRPDPGPGEVRVRVRAASFNGIDRLWRRGRVDDRLPVVLGRDFAGTVDAVGPAAPDPAPGVPPALAAGDAVYGYVANRASNGTHAEYVCLPAALVARMPAGLSFAEAAAVPVAGMTAYRAVVHKARVRPGEAVLVAGAAGGVGSFAVALLRHLGAAPILTTAGSDRSAAYLVDTFGLLPEHVVRRDRHRDAPALLAAVHAALRAGAAAGDPGGVAAAFDFAGGVVKRLCFDAVAPDGRVVSAVEEPADYPLNLWDERTSPLVLKGASFHFEQLGARARYRAPAAWAGYRADLEALGALYAAGALAPPAVEVVGPLGAAASREAHRRLEAGGVAGKLVLIAAGHPATPAR